MTVWLHDGEGAWHVPIAEDPDAIWRPIACGGGISFPGNERTIDRVVAIDGTICRECAEVVTDA